VIHGKVMEKFGLPVIPDPMATIKVPSRFMPSITEMMMFGAFEKLFSVKGALGTRQSLIKTAPKVKTRGIESIQISKKTGRAEGLYLLKRTVSPRHAKVTTELEQMFKLKPRDVGIIAKGRIDYAFTPPLAPKKFEVLRIAGEKLRAPIITQKGVIQRGSGVFVIREGAKTGKLIGLTGYQKQSLITPEIYRTMSAGQKNILKELAKKRLDSQFRINLLCRF